MQAGTTRVVDADGASSSLEFNVAPFMSADGQSIAFATANGNQVANDRNRSSDVFVRNLVSGQMETVSVRDSALASSAPATTAGVSSSFSVSSNGRYVTFDSDANDVAPGDANGFRDVFVRDLVSGTNILVSTSTGGGAASGPSFQAAVSGDGRFVAFTSWASNLVDNDGNKYPDVFLHDLTNGTTALISVSTNGSGGNRDSFLPVVSQDGRFVMFRSKASDLAPGPFNTTWGGTFLRDLQAGVTYALATSGNNNLPDAAMTPDGHYVAVRTGTTSVGVWDSLAATFIYTNSPAVQAAISPDGQRLAVLTNATLVVADLGTGTNRIVASGSFGSSSVFRFSGDGRFLVYAMRDDSSVADTNAASDVYLYDSLSDTSDLISQSFDSLGTPNGASDSPDVSTDGRYVAYRTAASDTIPGDLNGSPDIVLYDRLSGSTRVVSRNISGVSTANYRSLAPVFSGDGQTLVFASSASDLVTGDFNFANDLFALSLTSPAITDTDGDSMDDQWELDHFSTMSRDGTGDFDNDGATDLFEFRTGTDASSTGSIFRVEIVQSTTPGESPVLTWPLAPGNSYHTQFKNDLNESSWQELNGRVVLLGDRGYVTDLGSASTQRYYRIVLTN
jgi:Tol biopolymer transport system component